MIKPERLLLKKTPTFELEIENTEVNTASCEDMCWMAMRCFAAARIRTIAGKESYRAVPWLFV